MNHVHKKTLNIVPTRGKERGRERIKNNHFNKCMFNVLRHRLDAKMHSSTHSLALINIRWQFVSITHLRFWGIFETYRWISFTNSNKISKNTCTLIHNLLFPILSEYERAIHTKQHGKLKNIVCFDSVGLAQRNSLWLCLRIEYHSSVSDTNGTAVPKARALEKYRLDACMRAAKCAVFIVIVKIKLK